MKASDLFVRCLEAEGIEFIFGVPGEENADFMMSLEQSTKIKFVLTRHEQGPSMVITVSESPSIIMDATVPSWAILMTEAMDFSPPPEPDANE